MTKRELVAELKSHTGASFITKASLARFFGKKNPRYVEKYLDGLMKIDGKYYFIPDVAEALMERGRI